MDKIKAKVMVASAIVMAASLFQPALAHVTVKPAQVGVASFQTFTTSVPVEKDMPTTGLRIVLPDGLDFVTPTVKPGWTITVKKEGEGEEAKATEIEWTGGVIPAGQRDDFTFSAKVPTEVTMLTWKAYQTYQDGSVVSWDREGDHGDAEEDENTGPASTTDIVDDLSVASTSSTNAAMTYSVIAIIFSLIAVALTMTNDKAK